jgi:hypothetical protein
LIVIVALLIGHATNSGKSSRSNSASPGALAPVTIPAPPPNPAADVPCTKVLQQLPVTLAGLVGRPAPSTWTYVAAWGDPAVVFRCGVPRPKELVPGSSSLIVAVDGVNWLPVPGGKVTVWTVVDRSVYVEVTVPKSYPQPPLGPLSDAIGKALPAVCVVDPNETDVTKLCTHRP